MALTTSTNPNGSYLQQADPQNFPVNATGAPPPNNYQAPAAAQQEQQGEVPKDEVGWYFVEQYYTTLNKTPERVHLFYNKRSTMVWGTEGESLPLAHGRADIQEKITAHEFKDCKVRVSNVDSQASANNGIVIQVLGEMSNNGLPHRKFSQTFFLAEQPNGYYVLNDIFRYLKDDDDIEEDDYEYAEAEAEEIVAEAVAEAAEAIVEDLSIKEATAVEIEVEGAETVKVEETHTLELVISEPVPEEVTASGGGSTEPANGTIEEDTELVPVVEEPVAPVEAVESVEEPALVVEEEPVSALTPAPVKEAPPAPPVPAPAPVPARPKTWANLVAGAGVTPAVPLAQPSTPVAVPAPAAVPAQQLTSTAQPASPAPLTTTTTTGANSGSQWQTADSKRHSRINAAPAGQTQAYVKNVTEGVSEKALKDLLHKYGNLKHFEVIRAKNCAFVEFETPAAFNAANSANPHPIGGSNVLVEERRPRGAVNGAYGNRAGMSGRGDGRPVSQGGRGGYQPRDGQRFEGGRGGRGGRGGNFGSRGARANTVN